MPWLYSNAHREKGKAEIPMSAYMIPKPPEPVKTQADVDREASFMIAGFKALQAKMRKPNG